MLDGVYRRTDGEPVFVEVPAPTDEALQALLHKIIGRLMKLLTRRGVLVEEEGSTYLADSDGDSNEARPLRRARRLPQDAIGPARPTRGAGMERHDLQSCIRACYACADACDHCAIACLNEADPAPMARCVALDIDCAQSCRMAAGFMARDSHFDAAVCELCARLCDACATECGHHTVDHCQACAAACRSCAQVCRAMVEACRGDAARAAHAHPTSGGEAPAISVG